MLIHKTNEDVLDQDFGDMLKKRKSRSMRELGDG